MFKVSVSYHMSLIHVSLNVAFAGPKRHFARPEATGCKVLSVYCTATLFTDKPINEHGTLDIYDFQSQPQ